MTQDSVKSPILEVLAGNPQERPPVWLMRQAGRYLPEYRAVRARAGGFLDLCFTPELASEVTLQPIRRFGFDAAILFSDILVIPHALGQQVRFEAGEGPRLEAAPDAASIARLRDRVDHNALAPVYETIGRVRGELPKTVAFLGFCGAPWTVATYMVAGRGTEDQAPARLFAYRDPDGFGRSDQPSGGGISRLPRAAARGGSRCGTDLRYLGWHPVRRAIRSLVHCTGTGDRREGAEPGAVTRGSSRFRVAPAPG